MSNPSLAKLDQSDQSSPLISVVVPTLDEAGNIDRLLERLLTLESLSGNLEIVIADDHSSDGTAEKVREWGRSHPVRLVQRDAPPDLTAAVVNAARCARGRWVVVMDADGSHAPEIVPRLMRPLCEDEADIVVGSRYVRGGQIDQWPLWRRLISRAATLLAWPFTSVSDPMSGMFATARSRLAELPDQPAGYKILLELLGRSDDETRVSEVPISFTGRVRGRFKMGLATQWRLVQRLAALGGANLNTGNAARFASVGLMGLVVDLLVFHLLLGIGLILAVAHSASFLAATVFNFSLNYRWTFARAFDPGENVAARYLRFLVVALLALMMRGGVLAGLVYGLGISPELAIIPAVIVTAAINYLGAAFVVFPAREWQAPARVRWHLGALALIGYVFVLRLVYLGSIDLIPDEMYYWSWWALQPDLSYIDHPPLTSWLIAAGTWLAGDNAFGVRLFNLLLGPLTAWFVYLYGRDLVGRSAGLMAALLVFTIPAYFAGGFLMTPDAPLLAAWAATLYFLQRALIAQQRQAFFGLGLAVGLGLLAKYTLILLFPAVLAFMLIDQRARRWLVRPEPYLAAALALMVFSPVLIWNAMNDWASFQFQGGRRLFGELAWSSHRVIVYLLIMLAPLAGIVALWVWGPARRWLAPEQSSRRFMLLMAGVPAGLFALLGVFSSLKFHWSVPVWLAILPMVGATMLPLARSAGSTLQMLGRAWKPALLVNVLVFGLAMHSLVLGLPGVDWHEHDRGYFGWPETVKVVDEIEQRLADDNGKKPIVAGMSKWAAAAALSFYTENGRDNITARNVVGLPGAQWERWFEPDRFPPDTPVLLFGLDPAELVRDEVDKALVQPGPVYSQDIYRQGRRVQTLYYRIAVGINRPEESA